MIIRGLSPPPYSGALPTMKESLVCSTALLSNMARFPHLRHFPGVRFPYRLPVAGLISWIPTISQWWMQSAWAWESPAREIFCVVKTDLLKNKIPNYSMNGGMIKVGDCPLNPPLCFNWLRFSICDLDGTPNWVTPFPVRVSFLASL